MTDSLLEIDGAVVRHGPVIAVDRVSLAVHAGEVVALIGANGAGKSSLLNAIVGSVPLAAGSVKLQGRRIDRLVPSRRARLGIGFCPEGRRIFPGLSVRENLLAGASGVAGDIASRIEAMHALFPALAEASMRPAWQLSGGQQQMLAIGRAMMRDPALLILDEPTLGLAPAIVEDVLATVRSVAGGARAVLIADQNAAMVLPAADRAYLLQGGKAVAHGPAAALLADPALEQAMFGG